MSSGFSGPPKAISSTESTSRTPSPCRQLVHHVDERDDRIDRRLLVDAVAEIEDVTGPAAHGVENLLYAAPDLANAGEQHRRIQIALHRHVAADRKSTRLNSSHLGISYAVFC